MKTIVCFGDSNTWGYNAATEGRHAREHRWPIVLGTALGAGYEVIPEGQNGRTTIVEDLIEGPKRGRDYLLPCIESHMPVDLVVILLGTNDLKHRYGLSAWDIARGAGVLVQMVQSCTFGLQGRSPEVLLLAPPPVAKLSGFASMFEGAAAKSRELGAQYKAVAEELGCNFLDTGKLIHSSDLDGIHLEPEEQIKLGKAVAAKVGEIFGSVFV
ncbi:MAG TPA: SGNH/GDSL hydrolase family protein [Spirochaetia bacterium]|nr:SGNH/GDSL hydrolase family protein [Spirochaetia bacterium]